LRDLIDLCQRNGVANGRQHVIDTGNGEQRPKGNPGGGAVGPTVPGQQKLCRKIQPKILTAVQWGWNSKGLLFLLLLLLLLLSNVAAAAAAGSCNCWIVIVFLIFVTAR
jgi:hypothetical protein